MLKESEYQFNYKQMYWAGFTTMLSITLIFMIIFAGANADEKARQRQAELDTMEVVRY